MRQRKKINTGKNERKGTVLLWIVAGFCSLLLVFAAPWQRLVNRFFHPYLALFGKMSDGLADRTLLLRSRSDLARAVENLTRQNFRLSREAAEAAALRRENRSLRGLLALETPPGYRYLAAGITARDPWLWNDGFTIDRGSRDGVEPGLAVLSADPDRGGRTVLVGVVESVSRRSARVMTVLNPEFRISVSLPESGVVGFLNAGQTSDWDGSGAAIGFLPANRTFALNEPLYTTGFEALVPEGVLVGYLGSIETAALPFGNRLYRSGSMRPAADFARLGAVMVAQVDPAEPGEPAEP